MKEKLIIKNFGPIKSVDLDLGKITVLIGEQATGKSTIAKVLSICRYFSYIVNYSIDIEKQDEYHGNKHFSQGLRDWGIQDYVQGGSYIFYKSELYTFEFKADSSFEPEVPKDFKIIGKNQFIIKNNQLLELKTKVISNSDRFTALLIQLGNLKNDEISKQSSSILDSEWTPNENFFRLNVKKIMNNPLFIPVERGFQSIFSLGKSSIQNLSNALFNQLAGLVTTSNHYTKGTWIEPLSIYYVNQNGQGFTKKNSESSFHSLNNGASGYQSTIPIVLAVKYYSEIENRKRTFIVEEPEQNLFPKAQKKLMEFMVESVNKFDNQFILPTHSPYILTSLGNLIYARKLGMSEKGMFQKEVAKIIPKESWIDVKDVSVYYLNNGKAKDLVDVEECLINLDDLDNVSEIINTKFDSLLEIDIALEKEIK